MDQLAGFGSLGKEGGLSAERPVLIDRFLEDATEVDVDAIRDHTGEVIIGGVMEHVEEAGVHSGDSACALPPYSLVARDDRGDRGAHARHRRRARGRRAHQRAVRGEGEPGVRDRGQPAGQPHRAVRGQGHRRAAGEGRGARDGRRHARRAARARGCCARRRPAGYVAIKEAVLPFNRFPDADSVLGPEMRSTGEVMGIDTTFGLAFAKSQLAAGDRLPDERAASSCRSPTATRPSGIEAARRFVEAGLHDRRPPPAPPTPSRRPASRSTTRVAKVGEPTGTDAVELIALRQGRSSSSTARAVAAPAPTAPTSAPRPRCTGVPCLTTAAAGLAAANGILDWAAHELRVRTLQEFHRGVDRDRPAAAARRPCRPPGAPRWRSSLDRT